VSIFWSRFARYSHLISPVATSIANTSSAPVMTYITPSTTMGCASPEYLAAVPEPFSFVCHTPFSWSTLDASISLSGE